MFVNTMKFALIMIICDVTPVCIQNRL